MISDKPTFATTFVIAMAALANPANVIAEKLDVEFRVGGTYSDNIARTNDLAADETIAFGGIGLEWTEITRRIDFSLQADTTFNHYIDESFDDEVVGEVNGDVEFGIVPERIFWLVADRFGTLQTDPLNANTADNRGNVNSFSTGPKFVLPMGRRTAVALEGVYTDNWFEERDTGNEVLSGSVSLSRALSAVRSVSVQAAYEDIEFDNELLREGYERSFVSLGFDSEISSGNLSASLGYNEVRVIDETLSGITAGLSLSRQLSARTSLSLSYDQQYSSSGDILRGFNSPGLNFGETIDRPDNGDPFERQTASVELAHDTGRTNISLRLAMESQDYESDSALARDNLIFRIGARREFAAGWSVSADAQYRRGDYDSLDRVDDDKSLSMQVARRLTRIVSIDLGYRYVERSSDALAQSFEENQVTLTLRLNPE